MDIHKNARLTLRSREALARMVVEQGATRKAVAAAFRVGAKTAAKWVARFRDSGAAGLLDRCPRRFADGMRPEWAVRGRLGTQVSIKLTSGHLRSGEIALRCSDIPGQQLVDAG